MTDATTTASVGPATPPRRRRLWPWIVGLGLLPFIIVGATVVSFITLDRDAVTLRQQVRKATDAQWQTKCQISIGRATLGAVRLGLLFVHDKDIADARLALAAVKHASVGVYALSGDKAGWSRERLFAKTDLAMQARGWTRLVGVADGKDTVLIYAPADPDLEAAIPLCLAVVNGRDLVVVSTAIDAEQLAELIHRRAGEDIRAKLHLARL